MSKIKPTTGFALGGQEPFQVVRGGRQKAALNRCGHVGKEWKVTEEMGRGVQIEVS